MSEMLPDGWVSASLNEVGQLFCGQSPASKDVNTDGNGTLYITGPEQWDGEKIRASKWTTDPRRLVPDHCLFITVKGAGVGILFPGVACAIGRDVYAYQPSRHVSGHFIRLALQHSIDDIIQQAAGLIPGLTRAHLLGHCVWLPPLVEQQRIAAKVEALLGRVHAARQRLAKLPAILKRFRQSVLAAACSGRLTAEWRRDGGEQADFPGSWQLVNAGTAYEDARYGTSVKCGKADKGTPVLRVPNIARGVLELVDLKYAELSHREGEALAVQEGDLIVCRTNGSLDLIGKAAVIPPLSRPHAFASYLIRLRLDHGKLLPNYFHGFLSGPAGRDQIEERARTTAGQFNLNLEILRDLELLLPPLAEQREIVRRVEAMFRLADAIEKRVASATGRAEKLTQAILAKAFRGELVFTEAELARREGRHYEPASILLERIRADWALRSCKPAPSSRRKRKA
jgi:type I restriction enzyme S subunit